MRASTTSPDPSPSPAARSRAASRTSSTLTIQLNDQINRHRQQHYRQRRWQPHHRSGYLHDTTGPFVGCSNGVETLNGTILPASTTDRTLVTEFDASASGSGEIDPQDISGAGATTPTAGYAFVVSGYDQFAENGFPAIMGGIINVDGPGTISGTGSVFDANDGYSGTTFAGLGLANTSVVSAPDSSGRVTFILDSSDPAGLPRDHSGWLHRRQHPHPSRGIRRHLWRHSGRRTALSQGANTGTFGTTSVVSAVTPM